MAKTSSIKFDRDQKKLTIPIKIKIMLLIRNIKAGNLIKFLIILIFQYFFNSSFNLMSQTQNDFIGTKTDIKILDKISSKNELINLNIEKELLSIKTWLIKRYEMYKFIT